jgi:two-component system, NarL family, response regulator NreC
MSGHLRLAADPDPAEPGDAGHPIRVVLGDDHSAVRRSLRLLLETEDDVEVVAEAGDISHVVRHVHGHAPNVLVLDLQLHNGSTIVTIRQLRGLVPDTQIVVLTMEASAAFANQALAAGAIGFVLKDRADSDLPAALRAAVEGEEFVSDPIAGRLAALRSSIDEGGLTPRELEVLRLIALGHTSGEIGTQLHISRRTVESHRTRIHHKLQMKTRAELVRYALGRHLVEI